MQLKKTVLLCDKEKLSPAEQKFPEFRTSAPFKALNATVPFYYDRSLRRRFSKRRLTHKEIDNANEILVWLANVHEPNSYRVLLRTIQHWGEMTQLSAAAGQDVA